MAVQKQLGKKQQPHPHAVNKLDRERSNNTTPHHCPLGSLREERMEPLKISVCKFLLEPVLDALSSQ